MVHYRRNRIPGGTYFFTVTLRDRRAATLIEHIDALCDALWRTLRQRPLEINAMVVLPDHIHAVWTLPSGDVDYAGRWKQLKSCLTRELVKLG
jgi:putative transposase